MSLRHLPNDQQAEFEQTGRITSADFLISATHDTRGFPFNPYDYQKLLSSGAIGSVPNAAHGTRVGIIGAGAAGLCAAYELMKVGLVPVIYEASNRIGGRVYSHRIANDPRSVLELGAMRVPTEQQVFAFYKKAFKINVVPFPNPGATDTMLWYQDQQFRWRVGTARPAAVDKVYNKFASFLETTMKGAAGSSAGTHRGMSDMWDNLVRKFEQSSLLGAMAITGDWNAQELAILGALGAGTGGLSAQLHVAALEMFRAAIGNWGDDQLIQGNNYGVGLESLTNTFWEQEINTVSGRTSVKQTQENESWRPGVAAIRATANRTGVEIEDQHGNCETFAAAILTSTTRASQLGINIDESLLSSDVWGAVRRIHYMSSTKIMCSSKTKFWLEEDIPAVTITDRPTRASYFMDYGDNAEGGALLLAYTWGDDSNKLMAQTDDQLVAMCRDVLGELYGNAFTRQELSDFQVVSWQQEAGYNGAFRLSYAGQYKDHNALFNQARASVADGSRDGFFLAGEGVSWEGGWIDGALQSALDASCCVVRLLGGKLSV